MNNSVLAIDAGNTRIKWGLHDGVRWVEQSWLATARAGELKPAFAALSPPRTVVVSNVAGEAIQRHLAAALPTTPLPHWIKSVREQCGVRNCYADSAQLGCDRWAALIGARRIYRGTALVVNAGTALTVDALTGDGVFLGGIIVPGVQLMHQALAANTAALPLQPGKFSVFPDTTADALVSGAIDALCGAIERMARFIEESGQAAPMCVLSGGGAELIAAHLNLKAKVVDNLVLEGLLTLADET